MGMRTQLLTHIVVATASRGKKCGTGPSCGTASYPMVSILWFKRLEPAPFPEYPTF